MIGFGELRRRSIEWRIDLADVERAYATDWLLKGIFAQAGEDALVLRGGAALRYAYSANYPIVEMPEFLAASLDEAGLGQALAQAAHAAADASGLAFAFESVARGNAKVAFTGPLGRRSAAQPHISLSFIQGKPRLVSVKMPLLHPFSDECAATLSVIAIEELIGERMATLSATPRARDVFDLWFAATQVRVPIRWEVARALAQELAKGRDMPVPRSSELFDPAHRTRLAGMWDASLRSVPGHPTFEQVENDLAGIV